jgi:hypothetical protein
MSAQWPVRRILLYIGLVVLVAFGAFVVYGLLVFFSF